MFAQIKKIEKQPDKYGNHLVISMIGLYDDTGKWIKWISLNDATVKLLASVQIILTPEVIEELKRSKNESA